MTKQINIIYGDYHIDSSMVYENADGQVWISRTRKNEMYNIFQGSVDNSHRPEDSIWITEPVVVNSGYYNTEYLSRFNKVFGCFDEVFENTSIKDKFIHVNYGTEFGQRNADELRQNWLPWNQRNGVIIVSSGHKHSSNFSSIYDLRLMLADFFYENGFDVSWYGYNGINRPYYKGYLSDVGNTPRVYDPNNKIKEICKYKFNICTENTYNKLYSYNYLTEKLPHGIYGGAIPLYMGCYNIEDLAPANTFFDLRNFVLKDNGQLRLLKQPLLAAIKELTELDLVKYNNAQYNYIKNGIRIYTDLTNVYKIFLSSF